MRKLILFVGAAMMAGCSQQQAAVDETNDGNVAADANVVADANAIAANTAAGTALASINETSWEFTDAETGKPMQLSVDAAGKYITNSGKEHIDHGTAAMKDRKVCFTSAMTKEVEVCWTDPMLSEGASGETTSSKGEKLTVKRVAYVPLTM